MFLGAEPRRAGFIDRRALRDRFERLVADAGFDLQAGTMVGRLPLAQQQQVEILRALAREADLIVLDEPTASLSATETERLHEVVRGLRSRGQTVILVSHFLAEVLDLSDTVTVLRDGRVVRTGPTADETEASLVTGMLGRPVGRAYPDKRLPPPEAPVALVDRWPVRARRPGRVADRSGPARSSGWPGSSAPDGRSSPGPIYGANAATAGGVHVGDAALPGKPGASIEAGVAMIPESRKDDGLILRRPIRENVSLTSLRRFQRFGFVRRGAERAAGPRRARARDGNAPARGAGRVAVGRQPAEAPVRPGAAHQPGRPDRGRADPRDRRRGEARHLRGAGRPRRRRDGRSC